MSSIVTIVILALILVILLIVIGIIIFIASKIREAKRKVSNISRLAFGTSNIGEGIKKMQYEYSTTPKSVCAMTSVCLPKITADFPDINIEEMKTRAQNALTSYLMALDTGNPGLLQDGNDELKEKVANKIHMMENEGADEHYENIHIHRTEIKEYSKQSGRCIITFQSSVEYLHYLLVNGALKAGNKNMKEQSRYNIDLIYIQDRDFAENQAESALGLNCPNCGAAITSLGEKCCPYCGSALRELNIHVWGFSDIKEC